MDKLDRLARAAAAEDEQNFHTCEGEPPPGCANDDTDVRKEAHQGVKDSHQGVKDFLQTPLTSPLNKSLEQHHVTLSGNVQRAKASNNSSTDKIPSKADQKRQQSDQQSFKAEDVAALARLSEEETSSWAMAISCLFRRSLARVGQSYSEANRRE
ncbi:hypothetical protein [Bradyrhizobium valentinum]|uniref:hypothetical protein n=1 Tax=Bradyrhizobium valentinum TaxID=1518501 RepID=UPI0012E3E3B3|nr:hypothetical protein [Bradyrhizobium valentinum]